MTKKTTSFTIKEAELAKALEISHPKLAEVIKFFDSDPNDQWELRENDHFVYLNKKLDERLFSEQGAYAIAKYMDEHLQKSIWEQIKEFITGHKEKIRNNFINQKIIENSSSLTVQNNRQFLAKKDVVNIFCTSYARLNKAFEEIQRSPNPMKIAEDFDDINGVRYYSLSGFYKLSRHLGEKLTAKDRRGWCAAIEVVGKKTFKLLEDQETARAKKIATAMKAARKRDKDCCQITGKKHDKFNKAINIAVHHIYSKKHYPFLEACLDNLITLTQEVHDEFHAWNSGSNKPSTADLLMQFAQKLYPENYEVILKLSSVKKILKVNLPT